MKKFTYNELQAFVKKCLATNQNVITCTPRSYLNDRAIKFIKLTEDISYEVDWHGGIYTFKSGDYLHAEIKDIYGLKKETFERCYRPVS